MHGGRRAHLAAAPQGSEAFIISGPSCAAAVTTGAGGKMEHQASTQRALTREQHNAGAPFLKTELKLAAVESLNIELCLIQRIKEIQSAIFIRPSD